MAAPKGNRFALFNNGGRPPFYDSAEELGAKIQEYFDSFFTEVEGVQTMIGRPTVTGLTLFLGFIDKKSLRDYKAKEEFSPLIKKALTVVEMNYEEMLGDKSCTGAIFALKNMGWMDRSEIDLNNIQKPTPKNFVDYSNEDE